MTIPSPIRPLRILDPSEREKAPVRREDARQTTAESDDGMTPLEEAHDTYRS